MTREEALEVIKSHPFLFVSFPDDVLEALDVLIDQESVIDKIRAEILDCLKALDDIEKSGLNIYLPNEILGRRLTYQQCLEFIDKYKAESEDKE